MYLYVSRFYIRLHLLGKLSDMFMGEYTHIGKHHLIIDFIDDIYFLSKLITINIENVKHGLCYFVIYALVALIIFKKIIQINKVVNEYF